MLDAKRFLFAAASLTLLVTPAPAGEIPTEEQKADALKCAFYIFNIQPHLIGPQGMIDMTDPAVAEACALARANAEVTLQPPERLPKARPRRMKSEP